MGLVAVMNTLAEEARKYVPGYRGGMSLQIDTGQHVQVLSDWRFAGIPWTVESVGLRLMWLGVACTLAWLAAMVFDRFDTAKVRAVKKGWARRRQLAQRWGCPRVLQQVRVRRFI
jgi:hypothetical protein